MAFKRYIEIERVALVNYEEYFGKLATKTGGNGAPSEEQRVTCLHLFRDLLMLRIWVEEIYKRKIIKDHWHFVIAYWFICTRTRDIPPISPGVQYSKVFTSLLLCSWCKGIVFKWLTTVDLGVLEGRDPLLEDIDVTINPSKGSSIS
ncbi:hypothetical protein MKW98_025831 [Papaver atlanticum]|uniref:Uncharacterized protein n=1 Tax=Papaver atlanticum TaxID=357466 RepID=A0AAD4X2Z8_9MAGN|nr:hypothetical protein MKW98_025831 [Papaver atlanticum]